MLANVCSMTQNLHQESYQVCTKYQSLWQKFASLNSALWFYAFNSGSQMLSAYLTCIVHKAQQGQWMQRGGTWEVLHQSSLCQFTHPFHQFFSFSKASSKDLHSVPPGYMPITMCPTFCNVQSHPTVLFFFLELKTSFNFSNKSLFVWQSHEAPAGRDVIMTTTF